MSFLTSADYGLQIRDEIRGLLTDGNDALLCTQNTRMGVT